MFTGIVTDVGQVVSAERGAQQDLLLRVQSAYGADTITTGASISHAGVCLTVIDHGPLPQGGSWWTVQASGETLALTTLGSWQAGARINLERALKVGDELGGHTVLGHVDGLARVVSVTPENESHRVVIEAPASLAPFLAPKGSVALDGVSLTVNEVEPLPGGAVRFGVNIIPHTWSVTTLGSLTPDAAIHIEVDPMARYVARIVEHQLALRDAALASPDAGGH
jgi:riboflavin synthase